MPTKISFTRHCPINPLSSWNDGTAKRKIIEFVEEVIDQSSPNYVKPDDRIAIFDQDGTLWVKKISF